MSGSSTTTATAACRDVRPITGGARGETSREARISWPHGGAALGFIDTRTVRAEDGSEHDVIQAIGQLPWVDQLCPLMPHQYAVLFKSPDLAWRVLEAMIRWSPDSYRAYFRGYPRRTGIGRRQTGCATGAPE